MGTELPGTLEDVHEGCPLIPSRPGYHLDLVLRPHGGVNLLEHLSELLGNNPALNTRGNLGEGVSGLRCFHLWVVHFFGHFVLIGFYVHILFLLLGIFL